MSIFQVNDLLMKALGDLGYTGALNDRMRMINASVLNGGGGSEIITVKKLADESRSSDIIMRVDNELFTGDLEADSSYLVFLSFSHDGPTAADLRFEFNGPAGATMDMSTDAGETGVIRTIGNSETVSTQGVGNQRQCLAIGRLEMGSTAGPLEVHWRQSASDAAAVTIFADATLVLIPTS